MVEMLRETRRRFDQTMFRYGNAKARVMMLSTIVESGYDLNRNQLEDYIHATQLAQEWHATVGKVQIISGIALLGTAKVIDNRVERIAALGAGVMLLLVAGKTFLAKNYMGLLNKAAKEEINSH